MAPQLPPTFKGLLFNSASEPAVLTDIPTPEVEPGSVIVKPLYCWVPSYANELYTNGNPRQHQFQFPLVGGSGAIGRVVAVGPDAAGLEIGDLVTTEPLIRFRDAPDQFVMLALGVSLTNTKSPTALSHWHHGSWAELVKMPLENVLRFDESKLQKQGVTIKDLGFFTQLIIGYGGLRDSNLSPGETVLISTATGNFGGAAVHVALAMGARVIAMGRNQSVLARLKALSPNRVETVTISGSEETDLDALSKLGPIDVFLDMTPTKAQSVSHVRAGIMAVRHGGRISLGGGLGDLNLPYGIVMFKRLTLKGTMMYSREQVQELIQMIETGILRLGPEAGLTVEKTFELEDWNDAIETAAKEAGAGRAVLFTPNHE